MWDIVIASTGGGTGIEPAMTFIVQMVLAVAGGLIVAAIAYRGIQVAWGQREDLGHWLTNLAIGGGFIGGSKIIGAGIVGFAVGMPLQAMAHTPALAGFLLGDLLYYGITIGAGMWTWRKMHRGA